MKFNDSRKRAHGETKSKDPVSLIEAAYQFERGAEWLRSVACAASTTLDFDRGVLAVAYDASQLDWVHLKQVELLGVSSEFARTLLDRPDDFLGEAFIRFLRTPGADSVLRNPLTGPAYQADFLEQGIEDAFAINAGDPTGHGCMFIFPDRQRHHAPARLHTWQCLAAHIAAGNRLRRRLETLTCDEAQVGPRAEAVITPLGRVEHAEGAAADRSAREALREALIRIERARSRRQTPAQAVELWQGLVDGRWSIVETFERDGKRYYLAHRNDPNLTSEFALTERERQILAYADLGQSNKLIAYTLGLSISSVSTFLLRARRKLRAASLRSLRPTPPTELPD
jgi:DNA-binding CsgD family transcriptional regulator